jgi:hypothetical protein
LLSLNWVLNCAAIIKIAVKVSKKDWIGEVME